MRVLSMVVALTIACMARSAEAIPYQITSRASVIDPVALLPLLQQGELALIEADGDRVKQTIIFAVFEAPRERMYDILMDVEKYPDFIRTIAAAKIKKRKGGTFSYDWELKVPLITLGGVRLQRGKKPSLIQVRGLTGNFRGAKERWELYPIDGGKKTLAAFYRALDVETGGLVVETLAKLEPSFGQALSLSSSYIHIRSLQRRALGLAVRVPPARTGPVPRFRSMASKPTDLDGLRGLMKLGALVAIESHEDGGLKQVAVMTMVAAPASKLASILSQPDSWPAFIPNFAEQTSKKLPDGRIHLDWELEVPFVNLYGESMMTIEDDGSIDVLNTAGDIPRGRFRWEFIKDGEGTAIPIHYAYSDVRQASFFTRMITDKEPLFEHGAVISAATVAMSAVKAHAEGRR